MGVGESVLNVLEKHAPDFRDEPYTLKDALKGSLLTLVPISGDKILWDDFKENMAGEPFTLRKRIVLYSMMMTIKYGGYSMLGYLVTDLSGLLG